MLFPGPALHHPRGTWGQGKLIGTWAHAAFCMVNSKLSKSTQFVVSLWAWYMEVQAAWLDHVDSLLPWIHSWFSALTVCAPVCTCPDVLCLYTVFVSWALISAWPWLYSLQSKFYLVVSSLWKCPWLLQAPGFAKSRAPIVPFSKSLLYVLLFSFMQDADSKTTEQLLCANQK